jgi:hypothetical protein
MTKSLEQIQKENRKFILEAIHGCSYEEALKKELGFNCKLIDKKHQFFGESAHEEMTLVYEGGDEISDLLYFLHFRGNPCVSFSKQDIFDKDKFEIIGKPLTLSRVLLAFSRKIFKNKISLQFPDFLHVNGFNWNFRKETLEEQAEEVQTKINELFNNK